MRGLVAVLTMTIALAGCGEIPRDPERTEALVRASGVIRLGWVEGTPLEPKAGEVLTNIEHATAAKVERRNGDSEKLLRELEEGKIDLVYGRFAQDSPWATQVHFGYALGWRAIPPKHVETPRFAFRNGENEWIMRVEKAAKQ